MALPLLPHEHNGAILTAICRGRTDVPAADQLVTYNRGTWVDGSVFSSTDISAYQQIVRTNNDVEGWQSRFNRRGVRVNLQFYSLVDLLETKIHIVSSYFGAYCRCIPLYTHTHTHTYIYILFHSWMSFLHLVCKFEKILLLFTIL